MSTNHFSHMLFPPFSAFQEQDPECGKVMLPALWDIHIQQFPRNREFVPGRVNLHVPNGIIRGSYLHDFPADEFCCTVTVGGEVVSFHPCKHVLSLLKISYNPAHSAEFCAHTTGSRACS